MDQRLSIITLTVSDLDRSRAFYEDVFGWSVADPDQDGIAFFQLPGIMFSLYPLDGMSGEHGGETGLPRGFTLAHNVNSKDEVDELFQEVVKRGATALKEPEEVFWGGYSCYVAGPDGEQWEIAFNPHTAVNDDGTFGDWSRQ